MARSSTRPIIGPALERRRRQPWWIAPLTFGVATIGAVVLLLMASAAAGLSVAKPVATIVTAALTIGAMVMLAEMTLSSAPQPPTTPRPPPADDGDRRRLPAE